ncbi:TadE/TadG family type IV pilus assembly protein [Candidatus Ruminimicrobiellum ovillum]|uniref:TadE/TadG family type IV pilus assembly protein n=1 Tax=Candidatus Ruminimicrobiellum ovillum TaxID=1947927 RepID=UPI003559F56F
MLKNKKGQAFTEAVFIFPVIIVLIFSVVWFARVLLTWQQLVSATRYGTDMIANTTLSGEDIKKDIKNYLTNKMIEGRRLDTDKIKDITVDIKNYNAIDYNNITDLSNISNIVQGLFVPSNELSTVSISYSYDLPKIMNIAGMDEFIIKTKLSVLAGSGCKNKIHKRK